VIVTEKVAEVRERLDEERRAGRRVAMVGTSGGTHEGHLSLVRRAKEDNDFVAVFWNGALKLEWASGGVQGYVRDIERDRSLAEAAGVDLFFVLVRDDLYQRPPVTFVTMPTMMAHLAGMPEAEHLELLVTMVLTLVNIMGPGTTYFGEKDWQQLVMFQRMALDLKLPASVVGCPTLREADGLAISSRNAKLRTSDRALAPTLHRALREGAEAVAAGERDATSVTGLILDRLRAVSAPDYVVAVEAPTLRPLERLTGDVRLMASSRFGGVPLVDNVGIGVPEEIPS
jgi:pantoate--beta-alanine ligase